MEQIVLYVMNSLAAKGIKIGLTAIVMGLSWLTGGMDEVAWALLGLMGCDFILGFIYAWRKDSLRASKFRDGLSKFTKYGMAIIVGNLLDVILFHKSNVDYGWRNSVIVYLGLGEGISVFKHLVKFNVNLPIGLIKKLENYREDISGRDIKTKTVPVNH